MKNRKREVCPYCKEVIIGYSAISRTDNETQICSKCGMREALKEFIKNNNGGKNERERMD